MYFGALKSIIWHKGTWCSEHIQPLVALQIICKHDLENYASVDPNKVKYHAGEICVVCVCGGKGGGWVTVPETFRST